MYRNILLSLFLLSAFVICPLSWGQWNPLDPELEQSRLGNRFALLIGVNQYPFPFSSLQYAESDMTALAAALERTGFPQKNIILMTTAAKDELYQPTAKNIQTQIEAVAQKCKPGDILWVAFSGHGAQLNGKAFLCPCDLRPNAPTSMVSRDWIYDQLDACKATHKLFLTDSCRSEIPEPEAKENNSGNPENSTNSGNSGNSGNNISSNISETKGKNPPVAGNRPVRTEDSSDGAAKRRFALMASCQQDQYSIEPPELKHGLFLYFLIEGLNGGSASDPTTNANGEITLFRLFDYASARTIAYARRQFSETQNPTFVHTSEISNFVVARINPQDRPPQSATAADRWTKTVNGVEYAFRYIPPGTAELGSPESEAKRRESEGLHSVSLTGGFWMLETEVTQKMWETVMGRGIESQRDLKGKREPLYGQGDSFPVYYVNWDEANEFCRKFSDLIKIPVRLPTEAQWEYSCRAGMGGPFHFGDAHNGTQANSRGAIPYGGVQPGPALNRTVAVKTYRPNDWGLYDMHGNVREWTQDRFGLYHFGRTVRDPQGAGVGTNRVNRGGGFYDIPADSRCASRFQNRPDERIAGLGFRVCLFPQKGEGEEESRNRLVNIPPMPESGTADDYLTYILRLKGLPVQFDDPKLRKDFQTKVLTRARAAIDKILSLKDLSDENYEQAAQINVSLFMAQSQLENDKAALETARQFVRQVLSSGKRRLAYDLAAVLLTSDFQQAAADKAQEAFEPLLARLDKLIEKQGDEITQAMAMAAAQAIAAVDSVDPKKTKDLIDKYTKVLQRSTVKEVKETAEKLPTLVLISRLGLSRDELFSNESNQEDKNRIVFYNLTQKHAPGERATRQIRGVEYAFRWCPPGKLYSAAGEGKIESGFWTLETEVTQKMWTSLMPDNPSEHKGENLPVENVTWDEARRFCQRLGEESNLEFGLPRPWAWEYACQAGSREDYGRMEGDKPGVLGEMGWYQENSEGETHAVAGKKPNLWGLFDMHGNVYEWTYSGSGSQREIKGGSFLHDAESCISYQRRITSGKSNRVGFRFITTDDLALADPREAFKPQIAAESRYKPGERMIKRACGVDWPFRWCPPGKYVYRFNGENRWIRFDDGFWALETEVTQAMWEAVMGANPSHFKGADKPVENVNWFDAQNFCLILSAHLQTRAYLPSKEQWNYAAQAGTGTRFSFGNSSDQVTDFGNVGETAMDRKPDKESRLKDGYENTAPVGRFKPNPWGLLDMYGNVWEWCAELSVPSEHDELIPLESQRGGQAADAAECGSSWWGPLEDCSQPSWRKADQRSFDVGLRVFINEPKSGEKPIQYELVSAVYWTGEQKYSRDVTDFIRRQWDEHPDGRFSFNYREQFGDPKPFTGKYLDILIRVAPDQCERRFRFNENDPVVLPPQMKR